MIVGDVGPLGIGLLLVLLVMAMVGIEDVGKLADFVLGVHGLDVHIFELGVLELLLDILQLLGSVVVEGVEEFLQATRLPRTIGHVWRPCVGCDQRRRGCDGDGGRVRLDRGWRGEALHKRALRGSRAQSCRPAEGGGETCIHCTIASERPRYYGKDGTRRMT